MKELKALECQQRRQRQEIFDAEDEIEAKRDQLIDALEKRLKQKTILHPDWVACHESQPLSISLPVGAEPYHDVRAQPFFSNRDAVVNKHFIKVGLDRFKLQEGIRK